MKLNFGLIATAAALAFTSLSSSAAINTSSNPDLLFVAFNPSAGQTYVRDLGALSQLSSNQTFNAPTGSIFTTQFTGTAASAIQWDVVALDATTNNAVVYMTNSVYNLGGNDSNGIASVETASLGGYTQLQNPVNGYMFANGEYSGSTTVTNQTNALVISNNFSGGFPMAGQGVGTSLNFVKVDSTGTATQLYLNAALKAIDPQNGSNAPGGYFTLADANGDLTWTESVSSVPLPGAAALFLPGLLGMFGIGRRRSQTQA